MEQHLNNLVSYLSQSASLSPPSSPTLTPSEIQYLFSIVDVKRKRYLDLGEVFQLVGDVNEKEMFWVFKWMDKNKRGVVTAEDLERVMGGQESGRESKLDKNYVFTIFYKRVDAIKDKYRSLESLKERFHFNQSTLAAIFNHLLTSAKTPQLSVDLIINFLSERSRRLNLSWNGAIQTELKEMAGSTVLNLDKFVEMFGVQLQQKPFHGERLKIEEFTQDIREKYGLNKAWESDLRPKSSQIPSSHDKIAESHLNRWQSSKYSMERKLSRNHDKKEPYFSTNHQNIQKKLLKNPQTSIQSRRFALGEQNIDEALKNIEKRREQLKKDSLERKKLIESVMQRKKQINGLNGNGDQQQDWDDRLNSLNNMNSYAKTPSISTLKKSSANKSYLTPSHLTKPLLASSAENAPLRQGYISDKMQRFNKWQQQIRNQRRYDDGLLENIRPDVDYSSLLQNRTLYLKDEFKVKSNPYDLQEILNKYQHQTSTEPSQKAFDECKPFMRSNSGLLGSSNSGLLGSSNRQQSYAAPSLPNELMHSPSAESLFGRNSSQISSSLSKYPRSNLLGSKQNLMRRAQQQASRKIQQIERKARMKVMQKKAMGARWGK